MSSRTHTETLDTQMTTRRAPMPTHDDTPAPEGATLTLTDVPAFGGGDFIERVVDRVLTNVDAEFSERHIEALHGVARGFVHVLALTDTLSSCSMHFDTFVALIVAAVAEPAMGIHEAWGKAKERPDYHKQDWNRAGHAYEGEQHTLSQWLSIVRSAPGPIQPWEHRS